MAKILSVTLGTDWVAAGQVATLPVMQTAITQALFGNVDRDHFASGTNPIVSSATAPTSPAVGLGWFNESTGVISCWSGSEWVAAVTVSATAPVSASNGKAWYDSTLRLLRIYDTIDTIAGWHPVTPGYQLMHNRSGGTVAASRVVVSSTAGTSNREFTTSVIVKDQSVCGVLLESTNSNAAGLVAMVSGGAVVDVLADDAAADGAVVKGDGLVTYSVAGECRTVGALPTNPYIGIHQRVTGTPCGCFAVALGAKDATTHLVRARLLGYVGSGAFVTREPSTIVSATISATFTWASRDVLTHLLSSKHSPPISSGIFVKTTILDAAPPDDISITHDLSADRSTIMYDIDQQGNVTTSGFDRWVLVQMPTVNDDAAATGIGTKFAEQAAVVGAGNSFFRALELVNYTYVAPFFAALLSLAI
jgi:hypothetical protein